MKTVAIISVLSAAAILVFAAVLSFCYPMKYKDEIESICNRYGVPQSLVRGVIKAESGYNELAESRAGAKGLMQLMPSTAEWMAQKVGSPSLAEELFEPENNIELGTAYLKYLLGKYTLRDALAAYNAGEGNLLKWQSEGREDYAFKETRDYVKRVLRNKKIYEKLRK